MDGATMNPKTVIDSGMFGPVMREDDDDREDSGKRHDHVGHEVRHRLQSAAVEPGEQTAGQAEDERYAEHDHARDDRLLRSPDQPGEDVAPRRVRARAGVRR